VTAVEPSSGASFERSWCLRVSALRALPLRRPRMGLSRPTSSARPIIPTVRECSGNGWRFAPYAPRPPSKMVSGPQTRLLSTSHGTNRDAFSVSDWGVFVSLVLIWGASFLFIAIRLDHFHPGVVTLLRVGFGAGTLALIPRARRTRVDRSDWPRVAVLGLIWIAVPLTLFPIAQQWIDSAVAGMLNGAMPIFTAAVSAALLKELPGTRQPVGLLIGIAGAAAISIPSAGGGTTAVVGVLLVLAATLCYAIATNIVTPLQQRY